MRILGLYIYIYSERKLQLLNLHCLSASDDLQEEFEETKGVIRIHISKKKRQHNGQKKKYKRKVQYTTRCVKKLIVVLLTITKSDT